MWRKLLIRVGALRRVAVPVVAAVLTSVVAAAASAGPPAGTGTHPFVVVLCNFSDETAQPNTQSYYQTLFSDAGAGQLGELDFWHDVSFGQASISGTIVTSWVTAHDPNDTSKTLTRGQWINLNSPYSGGGGPRLDKILACADGTSGIDFTKYWGVIAVFPEARSTLASPIDASQTTITVTTTVNFPDGSAPFLLNLDSGATSETVNVTGISGNTLTVVRGANGTTAQSHAAGVAANIPGDLGGVGSGQNSVPVLGSTVSLSTTILPSNVDVTGASHEMGHALGYEQGSVGAHSRAMSSSTTDYGDTYDLMSQYWCPGAQFSADPSASNFDPTGGTNFGGSGLYNFVLCNSDVNDKGPALNAIDLDVQGWIPSARHYNFDNSSSNQATITLHTLSDPNALAAPSSNYLEARVPASVTIEDKAPPDSSGNTLPPTNPPTCSGTGYACTTSLYYTVEYREKSGWDRGFPANAVMLHLLGGDSLPYWVDQTPLGHSGLLYAGDEYVDAANKTYVAVNSFDSGAHTATVTLGSRAIDATFVYSGDASGDFNDQVTLAGDLSVAGSGAPIPNAGVTLSLGTQSCPAKTDASGHASCSITISQDPGSATATASFGGDSAYASTSGSKPFTINPEESSLSYTGALTAHYHDPATVSATLTDPDGGAPIVGKTITFTLGVGDSCSGSTDGSGTASCQITPHQTGSQPIVASFGPDTDYTSSNTTKSFTITPEETTMTYDGPTVILAGASGATLTATLVEDGTNDADGDGGSPGPIPAQTVTLSLGSQHCTGITRPSGGVSCTIASVTVPLGPTTVGASFVANAAYQASSSTAPATVFAFPSRGAFVLGDATAAGAGPTSTVTWWGNTWSQLNALGGGAAPSAFKGFAGVIALPTTTPPVPCGSDWTTTGGNSPPPVTGIPTYMGVVVASNVAQSGSTISGDTVHIVVVKTNPAYAPSPGHPGNGTIVATFC
jgi:hypothetical protein